MVERFRNLRAQISVWHKYDKTGQSRLSHTTDLRMFSFFRTKNLLNWMVRWVGFSPRATSSDMTGDRSDIRKHYSGQKSTGHFHPTVLLSLLFVFVCWRNVTLFTGVYGSLSLKRPADTAVTTACGSNVRSVVHSQRNSGPGGGGCSWVNSGSSEVKKSTMSPPLHRM